MTSHTPRLLASLALALFSASAHAQEQTARLVKDTNRAPGDYNTFIHWILPIGKNVVFPMETLAHGGELWTSDGTPKGTRLLKDIVPGPAGSYPDSPAAFGVNGADITRVAFTTQKDATGHELWATDGTADGTQQIFKSPFPGMFGQLFARAGTTGGVFFENVDWNQADSDELFFSEGTAGRTWSLNPLVNGKRANFSDPSSFKTVGAWCYFIANDREIWSSDGQPEGTNREYTITPGWPRLFTVDEDRIVVAVALDQGSDQLWTGPSNAGQLTQIELPHTDDPWWIQEIVSFGDEIYFVRVDIDFNRQLWVTDGTTAGTRRILLHGGQQDEPRSVGNLTPWKGALYLAAVTDNDHSSLWRIDGAQSAPRLLASFTGPKAYLDFFETLATDDFLYFRTLAGDNRNQLWRTQGDPASTRPVKGTPSISNSTGSPQLAATGAGVFLAADRLKPEEALWRLRGKTHGAIRLTKPEKKTADGTGIYPTPDALPYETFGGKLLSFVYTGRGQELLRMNPDGTGARSIWTAPGAYSEFGFQATTPNGAIFTYYDGVNLRQVWVTDGTARGTRLLGDHGPATDNGYPHDFVQLGDTCFYSVIGPDSASSLWRTDGTPGSTMKIVAADGTTPAPVADAMVVFQDTLYFLAIGADGKGGLWRTDGTQAGTHLVSSAMSTDGTERLAGLAVAGGELLFKVTLANFVDALWHSDGTTLGTTAASGSPTFAAETLSPAVDLDGAVIFHGRRWPQLSLHWWRHDATGTTSLRNDLTGTHFYPWHPHSRTVATTAGQLFYGGFQDDDLELWVTNGTDAGTRRVKDINPGPALSAPQEMLAVGNLIYFTADHQDYGRELWRSDGTEAGTVLVADIEPGPDASSPKGLKVMNGKLYFNAHRRDIGRELFFVDLPLD